MKTLHVHLKTVDSTQNYLKAHYRGDPLLVSATEQTHGRGRMGKSWIHQKNSLAFSFSIKPAKMITLTPLEMGVLICQFFEKYYQISLKLKWPNDLMTQSERKCGGILIETHNQDLFVGVGLNLSLGLPIEQSAYPPGCLDLEIPSQKDLCFDIYHYIVHNRLKLEEIKSLWLKKCIHLGKKMKVNGVDTGVFKSIGDQGEAIFSEGNRVFSGILEELF
jgi:BirA family biotin operon repressor/biotin-[acetyl-CoA-carboxylase] ligase